MTVDPSEMVIDIQAADGVSGGIRLTEWESEFVDSIQDQLNDGKSLTDRQLKKLESIWDRV